MKTFNFNLKMFPFLFALLLLGSCAKDNEMQEMVKESSVEDSEVQARSKAETEGCDATFQFLGTSPAGLLWTMDVYAAPCGDFDAATLQANYNWTSNPIGDIAQLEMNHDMTYWLTVALSAPAAGNTLNVLYTDPDGNFQVFNIGDSGTDPINLTTFRVNCGLRWRYDCPGNDGV